MLIDCPGQVGLLLFGQCVLKRRQRQRALRLCNKGNSGVGNALNVAVVKRMMIANAGVQKRLSHQVSIMCAGAVFSSAVLARPEKLKLFAHFKITTAPPTRDRWRIVRRGHGGGAARIMLWLAESVMIALKLHHAHAVNARALKSFTKAFWHSAKIFADNDGAMSLRFKRDKPQHVFKRITDIGAVRCVLASRA